MRYYLEPSYSAESLLQSQWPVPEGSGGVILPPQHPPQQTLSFLAAMKTIALLFKFVYYNTEMGGDAGNISTFSASYSQEVFPKQV